MGWIRRVTHSRGFAADQIVTTQIFDDRCNRNKAVMLLMGGAPQLTCNTCARGGLGGPGRRFAGGGGGLVLTPRTCCQHLLAQFLALGAFFGGRTRLRLGVHLAQPPLVSTLMPQGKLRNPLGSGGMRVDDTVNGSIDEEELGDGIVRTLKVTQKRGGKGYLHICAFANATLQRNRTDTKKNAKDAINLDLFPTVLLQIGSV
jgi:hypothetical protein